MNKRYQTLLSPVRIGKHVIKNRMLYPNASPHVLQGPETFPAEGYRAFNANLARNGAAIITIAEWNDPNQHKFPAKSDMSHMQSFDLSDPSTHNYFSLMAEEIHFYGSKLLVNVKLELPEGYTLYGGLHRRLGQPEPEMFKPLPKEMIPEVISAFVEKLRMYKDLGYDGMSMRCDTEILSQENTRDDEYSADTMENRSRLVREAYAAVKKELGRDFITEAVVAWEQPWGYGRAHGSTTADEVAEFCHLIDKDVDIFQIREHDGTRSHPTGFNFLPGEHPAVDFAARLKKEGVTALLEPIGGFQEPDEMEQYLKEGKCDLFGMARAFMADPEYGIKLAKGCGEDVTPCIKCNKCHGTVLDVDPDPWVAFCSVNPQHGLGHVLHRLVRETTPKKVAVIGGGAAGMRAAIIAAERGHDVTLYEKTGVLGGQLLHADYFEFKWPMKNYKNWLIRQLGDKGVKVIMNCEPSRDQIEAGGYDAVLAATGAVASVPKNIEGLFDENGKQLYPTCWDVWDKEAELGKHVVIVGGSETGMETAIHLLRKGHKVTMLTRQGRVAHNASRLHYITMSFVKVEPDGRAWEAPEWERYEEFTGIVNVSTKSVKDTVVTYVDADGVEHTIEADDVVICGGVKPLTDEAMVYAGLSQDFYPIGDCVGAGSIQVCNRQAFARASII